MSFTRELCLDGMKRVKQREKTRSYNYCLVEFRLCRALQYVVYTVGLFTLRSFFCLLFMWLINQAQKLASQEHDQRIVTRLNWQAKQHFITAYQSMPDDAVGVLQLVDVVVCDCFACFSVCNANRSFSFVVCVCVLLVLRSCCAVRLLFCFVVLMQNARKSLRLLLRHSIIPRFVLFNPIRFCLLDILVIYVRVCFVCPFLFLSFCYFVRVENAKNKCEASFQRRIILLMCFV